MRAFIIYVVTVVATTIGCLAQAGIDSSGLFVRVGMVWGTTTRDTTIPFYAYSFDSLTAARIDSIDVTVIIQDVAVVNPPYVSKTFRQNQTEVTYRMPVLYGQMDTPVAYMNVATGIGRTYRSWITITNVNGNALPGAMYTRDGYFVYTDTCIVGSIREFVIKTRLGRLITYSSPTASISQATMNIYTMDGGEVSSVDIGPMEQGIEYMQHIGEIPRGRYIVMVSYDGIVSRSVVFIE